MGISQSKSTLPSQCLSEFWKNYSISHGETKARRVNVSDSVPWAMSEAQPGTEPGLAKSQCYIHPSSRVTGDKSTLNFSVHAHAQDFHFPPPLVSVTISHISQVSKKPAHKSRCLRKGNKLSDVQVQKAVCFHKPMRFWAQMAACIKMTGS